MTEAPRLRSLSDRHAALDQRIAAEGQRPQPNASVLGKMKLDKLRLKEEMERMRKT